LKRGERGRGKEGEQGRGAGELKGEIRPKNILLPGLPVEQIILEDM
jgi:hypothetical protein